MESELVPVAGLVAVPTVTGVVPAITVAVSVTTVPEATVATALPPDVTASVVVVAAGVAAKAGQLRTTADAQTASAVRAAIVASRGVNLDAVEDNERETGKRRKRCLRG